MSYKGIWYSSDAQPSTRRYCKRAHARLERARAVVEIDLGSEDITMDEARVEALTEAREGE